jgi:hypothetical protein
MPTVGEDLPSGASSPEVSWEGGGDDSDRRLETSLHAGSDGVRFDIYHEGGCRNVGASVEFDQCDGHPLFI